MTTLVWIFGEGKDLTAAQMAARAAAIFVIAMVLVRVGGMRAFGRKTSFDTVIVITLGAVLSRAVVGASAFVPTLAAATSLCVVHRVLAMITACSPRFERFVKGQAQSLVRDGVRDRGAMVRAGISPADIDEAVRTQTRHEALDPKETIILEVSGQLSVIENARSQRDLAASRVRHG